MTIPGLPQVPRVVITWVWQGEGRRSRATAFAFPDSVMDRPAGGLVASPSRRLESISRANRNQASSVRQQSQSTLKSHVRTNLLAERAVKPVRASGTAELACMGESAFNDQIVGMGGKGSARNRKKVRVQWPAP